MPVEIPSLRFPAFWDSEGDADGDGFTATQVFDTVYRLFTMPEDSEQNSFAMGSDLGIMNGVSLATNWLAVNQFFTDVRDGQIESDMDYADKIPEIETKLKEIHDALLAERSEILVKLDKSVRFPHSSMPNTARSVCISARSKSQSYAFSRRLIHVKDGVSVILPPCYFYLFGVLDDGDEDSRSDDEDGCPPSVGDTFLTMLCQYAKHNFPFGSRRVILVFLGNLLRDADLPVLRLPGCGGGALSLLQLSPTLFIVPLLDMIRQISSILDPSGVKSSGHINSTEGVVADDGERAAFVYFMCVLAEKMERSPDLANFFITSRPPNPPYFTLLQALLPYVAHNSRSKEWSWRRDTCRYALSAVLSLARCPDPWVRDTVAAEQRVAHIPLMAASTTFVTLCKVPNNEDSHTEELFLHDVFNFWSSLFFAAPDVAESLQLAKAITETLVEETIMILLRSPDPRVYTSSCLVLTSLFRGEGAPNSTPLRIIAQSLAECRDGTTRSFIHTCLLPRLGKPLTQPSEAQLLTEFGYSLTQWTECEGTLLLLDALTRSFPGILMANVFRLTPTAITPVTLSRERVNSLFPQACQQAAQTCPVETRNRALKLLLQMEANAMWYPSRGSAAADNSGASVDLQNSEFLVALTQLLASFRQLPASVMALLTGLLVTLCVLPDARVLNALLAEPHGKLALTLSHIRTAVDRSVEESELAVSAAATHHSSSKRSVWTSLFGLPAAAESAAVISRAKLFQRFLQCQPLDLSKQQMRPEKVSRELWNNMKENQSFLEVSACLYTFRMELMAAVDAVTRSQQLLSLKLP